MKPEELAQLERMYQTFAAAEAAMGLPPADPERRKAWLHELAGGINLIARFDEKLAGHLALMPAEHSAEMACFVHQDYRRRGVATALASEAVRLCRARGLRTLWVLIGSDNNAARRGLLNYGFHTAWESLGELRMELTL
jgi:GNAT superfamily N-acetyltransferase